jgi:hypothetical protein
VANSLRICSKKGNFKTLYKEKVFNGEKYAILPSTRIWPQGREISEDKFAMRGLKNHLLTAVTRQDAQSQVV